MLAEVPGMCGVVDGGILPGLWGYEAGQSGVGDIFGWFVRTGFPAVLRRGGRGAGETLHEHLTALAAGQQVGEHGLIALDWQSGNRSVLVDHDLSGVLVGLTLATRPEDVYRALLEATAFGTRTIIETFETAGVPVDELIVAGGLTKNALLMQIYADVTRAAPSASSTPTQGPALGSAMHAAVAAGAYPDIPAAARPMGKARAAVYLPDPERAAAYDRLFAEYRLLHDYFGRGANEVMHRLRRRAEAVRLSDPPASRPPPPPSAVATLEGKPSWSQRHALPRPRDLVPHRQPGPVRRRRCVRSPTSPRRSPTARPPRPAPGHGSCGSRSSPTPTSIRRICQEANASDACVGVIAWMHTFSPAKMWIAGLDALDRPLLHLHTQYNLSLPWPSIDMDFMNLNQAAHGDREFGHIQSRLGIDRKIVAGHATDPRVVRARRGLGPRRRSAATTCAACASPASATTCATSPSPRATRSRPSCGSASP